MTLSSGHRFGVGAVLSMVLVAGLAVAALTSHAAGEARADDAQLELVSIEAGSGKTEPCVGMSAADGSPCLDRPEGAQVASTVLEEPETPKAMKASCPRASR